MIRNTDMRRIFFALWLRFPERAAGPHGQGQADGFQKDAVTGTVRK